jgi:hypothetical protein
VKLTLKPSADFASYFTQLAQKNWKDFIVVARGMDFLDPAFSTATYVKGNGRNVGDVDDAVMTDYFNKLTTATGDARKALGKQIWDRQLDQVYDFGYPRTHTITGWKQTHHNWVDTSWSAGSYGMSSLDVSWLSG